MNTEVSMVYVAEDPKQPGAAWGVCADDDHDNKQWRSEVAKTLADWVRRGAIVRHLTREEGCAMIEKWKRPERFGTPPGAVSEGI